MKNNDQNSSPQLRPSAGEVVDDFRNFGARLDALLTNMKRGSDAAAVSQQSPSDPKSGVVARNPRDGARALITPPRQLGQTTSGTH